MSRTAHVFTVFLLLFAMMFLSLSQISFAQTNDGLYAAIQSSIGSDDEELILKLAQAAGAVGITASDINEPALPLAPEEGVFIEETFSLNSQEQSSFDATTGLTENFTLIAFGVGLIIFLTLIFALSRRMKHEKERIDMENASNNEVDNEYPPQVGV